MPLPCLLILFVLLVGRRVGVFLPSACTWPQANHPEDGFDIVPAHTFISSSISSFFVPLPRQSLESTVPESRPTMSSPLLRFQHFGSEGSSV
ncbi:hypothetical protein BDR06DRAFT_964070 [Suillus hirtellus]|nr:hypothetical protein BDR06DRAFT_964070 [Suillus hirtellus]